MGAAQPAPEVRVIDGLVTRVGADAGEDTHAEVVDGSGRAWRVVGDLGELRRGQPVRLVTREAAGAWRVVEYQLRIPGDVGEIERFLASGFIPGVGAELARRLVAHFGADTLRVIDTSPARLTEVSGVGRHRASVLAGWWAEHRHLHDLATMMRGNGVPAAFVSRMVRYRGGDVMWLPTPPALVEAMLDLAGIGAGDHVIDLGAGDGAIVLAAARRGARAHGIDSNPELIAVARARAAEAGLADRATFAQGDIFTAELADATAITLFLLPSVNLVLRPRLRALRPGTRIVSNTWDMGDWPPADRVTLDDESLPWRTALLWTT